MNLEQLSEPFLPRSLGDDPNDNIFTEHKSSSNFNRRKMLLALMASCALMAGFMALTAPYDAMYLASHGN